MLIDKFKANKTFPQRMWVFLLLPFFIERSESEGSHLKEFPYRDGFFRLSVMKGAEEGNKMLSLC